MGELRVILFEVLAPILLLVGIGALMRRRFGLDLSTLSKLNIHLLVPAFVFDKVVTSTLSWTAIGGVVGITVLQVLTLGGMVYFIGRALRINRKTLSAIALAVMFYNSGNYGLPLSELAYPSEANPLKNGGAVQAFVVLVQNVMTFTVGLVIAASATTTNWREIFKTLFRMPVIYMLTAALIARSWLSADPSHHLPIMISKTADYLASALVPMALITLGVQLAANPRWPRWKPVSLVLVLRLLLGPIQMAGLLWTLHKFGFKSMDLWPWPAELLILTASVPTAINTFLLTLELDGDAELAADCVFWTTIFSCVTIALWLLVIRHWFS